MTFNTHRACRDASSMESWKWYVYIIECKDGSYYVGMTWSPDRRWEQHLDGFGSSYTAKHPPKKIVYVEEYEDLEAAREREVQIKKWSRSKKEKLISGEWTRPY